MALRLCRFADKSGEITESVPLITSHNGVTGGTVLTQLFVYNDNSGLRYEDVLISCIDISPPSETSWVSFSDTFDGTYSSTLVFDEIAGTDIRAFWIKVTVPPSTAMQNKADLFIELTAKEFAV